MSDETPSKVLGSLPRTRPHRRSQRRAARPELGIAPAESAGTAATKATAAESAPAESAPARATAKPESAPRARKAPAKKVPAKRATAARIHQPAQPAGTPSKPKPRATAKPKPAQKPSKPAATAGTEILGTAVQAAAELAEIGMSVSARALRRAVSRLPRP